MSSSLEGDSGQRERSTGRDQDHPAQTLIASEAIMPEGVVVFSIELLITASWKHFYRIRPHSSLGYRPPAPEVFQEGGISDASYF